MLLDLREYQSRAFDEIRALIRKGMRRILLVAPTGSGKTVTSSHLIAGAVDKGNASMFLAHRREILFQTGAKLDDAGLEYNMILSGVRQSMMSLIHLASIQTLLRREFPNVVFLIIDEAHHAVAATYKRIIANYPDAIIIGLTATPCRGDGRGLGGIFDSMVVAATVPELIDLGYLVPPSMFSATIPDLSDVKISRHDYVMSGASDVLNQPKLVGDIFDNWCVHAPMMRTLIFATDIAHSLDIERYFNEGGVHAEHIDGETPKDVRKDRLARHQAGEFPVLCNVGVATEGYDDCNIQAVAIARPTKSFGLFLQMAGRGLRPATDPGVNKPHLILLDHSDCWNEHGSPAEPVVWSLDPEGPAAAPTKDKEKSTILESWRCENCHYINDHGKYCFACGKRKGVDARSPLVAIGKLTQVTGAKGQRKANKSDKEKFWNECLWTCISKRWQVKRAAGMYKGRFGVHPRGFEEMPRGHEEWQMNAHVFHQKHLSRTAKRVI